MNNLDGWFFFLVRAGRIQKKSPSKYCFHSIGLNITKKSLCTQWSRFFVKIYLIPYIVFLEQISTVYAGRLFLERLSDMGFFIIYINFYYLRISTSCISRLVSSLFWHFQVRILILLQSLYRWDILETFGSMGSFGKI